MMQVLFLLQHLWVVNYNFSCENRPLIGLVFAGDPPAESSGGATELQITSKDFRSQTHFRRHHPLPTATWLSIRHLPLYILVYS
jgi:hypothetical protein